MNHSEKQEILNQLILKASKLIPMDSWSIKPTGNLLVSDRNVWGLAYKDGNIAIGKPFKGLDFSNPLYVDVMKHTLVHEIAHLIVGLHNHHNKNFKGCLNYLEKHLGVSDPGSSVRLEISNIKPMKHSFNLLLDNGEEVIIQYSRIGSQIKEMIENPCNFSFNDHDGVLRKIVSIEYTKNW